MSWGVPTNNIVERVTFRRIRVEQRRHAEKKGLA